MHYPLETLRFFCSDESLSWDPNDAWQLRRDAPRRHTPKLIHTKHTVQAIGSNPPSDI